MSLIRILFHSCFSWRILLLSTILLSFSHCDGPQSALNPAGPDARYIAWLWYGMFAWSTLVLLAVTGLWLYALFRQTSVGHDEDYTRLWRRRWIVGGGLILPGVSIMVLLVFGAPAGTTALPLPLEDRAPLRIEVTGHQWRWDINYPDSEVTTVNELHLPVGTPVDLHLTSADVIHSFWVPSLGGKLDAVPGRTNILRTEASETGSYRGQCAEFCGLLHAQMMLSVEIHRRQDFDNWLQAQQQ